MKEKIILLGPIFITIFFLSIGAYSALEKRKKFTVPLAFLTTAFDANGKLQEVFVTFDSPHEGWAISPFEDRYVKDTRRLRLDHTFKELPTQAYQISPFEADVLNKVCESFENTLSIFEHDLRTEHWDRCLYLDAYFPEFFHGFYYLYSASKNSFSVLPNVAKINDSLFENSFHSMKSDLRISYWRNNPDHILKLRITSKELIYQIHQWRKKDLINPQRDAWEDNSKYFLETYVLFIKLYFNLPPN